MKDSSGRKGNTQTLGAVLSTFRFSNEIPAVATEGSLSCGFGSGKALVGGDGCLCRESSGTEVHRGGGQSGAEGGAAQGRLGHQCRVPRALWQAVCTRVWGTESHCPRGSWGEMGPRVSLDSESSPAL